MIGQRRNTTRFLKSVPDDIPFSTGILRLSTRFCEIAKKGSRELRKNPGPRCLKDIVLNMNSESTSMNVTMILNKL